MATKDISDPDLPDCFRIGHRVEFKFNNITSLRTQRPRPQNIPGQYTDTDRMRYYPMRWIFANVDFVGFEYIPRYPAHVSICCVAVQLNVDQVDEFTKNEYPLESDTAQPHRDSIEHTSSSVESVAADLQSASESSVLSNSVLSQEHVIGELRGRRSMAENVGEESRSSIESECDCDSNTSNLEVLKKSDEYDDGSDDGLPMDAPPPKRRKLERGLCH